MDHYLCDGPHIKSFNSIWFVLPIILNRNEQFLIYSRISFLLMQDAPPVASSDSQYMSTSTPKIVYISTSKYDIVLSPYR